MAKVMGWFVLHFMLLFAGMTLAEGSSDFNCSSLPSGFYLGAASSAYQYEGASFEEGKGKSIWDTYTHKYPEKIADRSNGDVALDFYHRYKEDVKLMKYIGLNAFRMSVSWPRILPRGKLSGGVNKEGIAFYNNVFNELIANGITPFVTIFHWDLPQALEDEYRGFLSPLIIDDYKDFADVCFKEFGDRVKHWITFNEPFIFINGAYDGGFAGNLAPGRCSNRTSCAQGNSSTEPYVVGHHMLISHGVVVRLYKDKYQEEQKGEIGITLVSHWMVPYSKSSLDIRAARRALDFMYGWFMNPLVYGEYPSTMQAIVKDRLPEFSDKQRELVKGSYDFLGLNYYTGNYAAHLLKRTGDVSSTTDNLVHLSTEINGVPIGDPTGVGAFSVYPKGLHDLLVYTKEKYKNPTIYITETGICDFRSSREGLHDLQRIDYYNRHLLAVRRAIQDGVKVKGLFAWSFMDNFEWGSGYTLRFGIIYVDFNNGLQRILKKSALWFKNCLADI